MKVFEADLKVVAKVKAGGSEYEIRELPVDYLLSLESIEDKKELAFDVLEKAGLPKSVSMKLSLQTIKQLQELLTGEAPEKK